MPVAKKAGDQVISGTLRYFICLPRAAVACAGLPRGRLEQQFISRRCHRYIPIVSHMFRKLRCSDAGTVNGSGMLLMRAARVGKDTTLSQASRVTALLCSAGAPDLHVTLRPAADSGFRFAAVTKELRSGAVPCRLSSWWRVLR